MNLLNLIEKKELKSLNKKNPSFNTGDIVIVTFNNKKINKKRILTFTGIVISKKNKRLNSSFIVRKIKNNIGVEKTFQTYSPFLINIKVKIKNKYKKSKLFLLRNKR